MEKSIQYTKQSISNKQLFVQFERKNPNADGKISELDFAVLLVAYAALSEKKRNRMIRRVMNKFATGADNTTSGISLDEYLNFFRFLQNINDVDIALAVYHIAGASIDQGKK